jgi:hypothetical protein
MPEGSATPYPLGSHRRWVETLLLLLSPFLIAYIFLCLALHGMGITWKFVFLIALIAQVPPGCGLFWNGLKADGEQFHVPWLSDIAANLAYGEAKEDGIHFQKWFRHRFVRWRAIQRLDYWPDVDGRITLNLYSQRSPIIFIPEQQRPAIGAHQSSGSPTVDFISRKLNETWPGKSTFVISYEPPKTGKPVFFPKMLSGTTVRRNAVAHTLGLLLTLFLFYAYMAIRIGLDQYYWKVIVALWFVGLIIWIWARISKVRHFSAPSNDDNLEQPISRLPKK